MNHRIIGRTLVAGGVAAAAGLGLTACDAGSFPAATNYAIIAPVHAYGPALTEDAATVVLDEILESENYYLAYTSEGVPQRIFGEVVSYDQSSNSGSGPRDAEIERLAGELADAVATSPQNDPLEAIAKAAGELRQREGEATIVVLDNLLQTSGALALQNGTIYAEPDEVVEQLAAKGYLPDLTGVTIVLAQTGAVVPGTDQGQFTSIAADRLERLWVSILESGGARVEVLDVSNDADAVVTEQPMAIVPVEPLVPVQAGCSQGMPDSILAFEPDSATFVAGTDPEAVVTGVVAQLQASGCTGDITVIGTTSSAGTEASREHVATIRTEAVARLLASALSIDVADIRTDPVGYSETYCAHDRDADGVLVPELAAACRQVIISIA